MSPIPLVLGWAGIGSKAGTQNVQTGKVLVNILPSSRRDGEEPKKEVMGGTTG